MVRFPWRKKREQNAAQQQTHIDTESWAEKDAKVEVTQPKGFFTKVSLRAKVDLPPDDVYEILIAPDNSAVFKSIKDVTYRKVLHDDKKGRQKVEVEQLAAWKFLMFSGSFATRLFVFQDKQQRTVDFKLARPGLMKDFAGKWTVQPFTQSTLDGLYNQEQQPVRLAPWHSLTKSLTKGLGDSTAETSLVTLEQSLEPNFKPPKPFDGLIKGIAAQQLKNILDQLRGEVPKIKSGNPSLEAWKVRPDSQAKLGRDRHHISSCCEEDDLDGEHEGVPAERSMLQQVPLASIGDTVVTLPEAHDVPPGELHSQHVEQPGQSWDEWPTNSLWGALAGSKKQRKQVMWFDAIMDQQHQCFGRAGGTAQYGRRS
ncbi:g11146 [Coccomyxa viridis]|uniref:G11146 protein n=1 Tax=Coccomyxa viridis TaxID=1274662 RepID=A0ABP1GBP4_9CHLO